MAACRAECNVMNEAKQSLVFPFSLRPLPYAYDALEPHLDAQTMQLHHTKHHQGYIDQLNTALEDYPLLHSFSIEELLKRLDKLPIAIRQTVHDQGGGHLHHQLFWNILKPPTDSNASRPVGSLASAISQEFGSFEGFKKKFIDAGTKHFSAGWVFLALNPATTKLEVFSRPDHNNILAEKKHVLLVNDLWEHAYYLQHKSNRNEYLQSFWDIVNWEYVNELYETAPASKDRLQGVSKRFV